jgi:hypothetical protein
VIVLARFNSNHRSCMLVRLLTMYVAVTTVVCNRKLAGSEHLRTVPEARRAEIRALLQAAATTATTAITAATTTDSAGESSTSTIATAAPTAGGSSSSSSSTAAAVTGSSGSVSAAVADDLKRQVRVCQSIVY